MQHEDVTAGYKVRPVFFGVYLLMLRFYIEESFWRPTEVSLHLYFYVSGLGTFLYSEKVAHLSYVSACTMYLSRSRKQTPL